MERITASHGSSDAWICLCKNRPDLEGFFPCTAAGVYCEPTAAEGWVNLYRCDRCGRIVNSDTLDVVGRVERGI